MRAAMGALLLAVAAGAGAEAPIAFVADIRGNATIEGNGKLTFLAELTRGTRLLLGTGAQASIAYAETGAEFALSGPGEFRIAEHEVTAERGAAPKRRAIAPLGSSGVVAKAARSTTASLRMRSVSPATPEPLLEFPVSTRVADLKPTLRWRSDPSHGEYTVLVRDAEGREVWRAKTGKGSAQPALALLPAARYSWTVTGARGVTGSAEFETLGREAIARAGSIAKPRGFSDRVVRALLLEDLGALQEAKLAWGELARERPDMPELAALAR